MAKSCSVIIYCSLLVGSGDAEDDTPEIAELREKTSKQKKAAVGMRKILNEMLKEQMSAVETSSQGGESAEL